MNIDKTLMAVIVANGPAALREAFDLGLSPELLVGEGKKVFSFVMEYYRDNEVFPPADLVIDATGVDISSAPGKVKYYVKKLIERKKAAIAVDCAQAISAALIGEEPDAEEAVEAIENALTNMRKEGLTQSLLESLPALGKEAWDYYQRIKAGETGVLTPWPGVNDATLGFWPEDLVLFAGRLGTGKTFVSLLITNHAWTLGHKVLYVTTEMSRTKIALRFFALRYKLPYGDLMKGRLPTNLEKKFKDEVDKIYDAENLSIVGGNFDFSMNSFEMAIAEAKPDLVVLDGAYLLRVQGHNRMEKAANAFNELKRINKRQGVPIVVTSQLNRDAKSNKSQTVQAENIALTDVAGWNADLIFGLVQSDEMKRNSRMIFKPLKVREGVGDEVECHWNFSTMNFSELGSGDGGVGMPANAPAPPPGDGGGLPAFEPDEGELPW